MTKKDLNKLKAKLPRGYSDKIHKETGFSKSTISRVLNGDFDNAEIIESALGIAEKEVARLKKVDKKFKKIAA